MEVSYMESIPLEILECIIANLIMDIDALSSLSIASRNCLLRVPKARIVIPWTTYYQETMTVEDYRIYCKRRYHPPIKVLQGLYSWMNLKRAVKDMAFGLAMVISMLEDPEFIPKVMGPLQEELGVSKWKWIPLFGADSTFSKPICAIGLIPIEKFVPRIPDENAHETIRSEQFLSDLLEYVNASIREKTCEPVLPAVEKMFAVHLYLALGFDQDSDLDSEYPLPPDYVAIGVSAHTPTYLFRMPRVENSKKSLVKKVVSRTRSMFNKFKKLTRQN